MSKPYLDRMGLALSDDLPIAVFLGGSLDYRLFGTQKNQIKMLRGDYEVVREKSSADERPEVDLAFSKYLRLIETGYADEEVSA